MICEECGCENPDNAKFCKNCGKEFNLASDYESSLIESDADKKRTINNGSIYDWILPLLYWHNNLNGEYKLSKTKIISILVFIYLMYSMPFPIAGKALFSLIITIPVFLIGFGIHILMNN